MYGELGVFDFIVGVVDEHSVGDECNDEFKYG